MYTAHEPRNDWPLADLSTLRQRADGADERQAERTRKHHDVVSLPALRSDVECTQAAYVATRPVNRFRARSVAAGFSIDCSDTSQRSTSTAARHPVQAFDQRTRRRAPQFGPEQVCRDRQRVRPPAARL